MEELGKKVADINRLISEVCEMLQKALEEERKRTKELNAEIRELLQLAKETELSGVHIDSGFPTKEMKPYCGGTQNGKE